MTTNAPRYLTKSRFTLALECPTKLFYTGKASQYANRNLEDEFLAALAEGGFQVGELAKLMHPGGVEVTASGNAEALAQTAELLRQHTVTLYEAAIADGPFLVRVDILRKAGDDIELIEVKAKSFDSTDPTTFKGTRGGWNRDMLPYLYDIAFQRFVVAQAHPGWRIRSHLMMVDTSRRSTVAGLNQCFKIQRGANGRTQVVTRPGTSPESLGAPILTAVNVDAHVDALLAAPLSAPGVTGRFADVAAQWAAFYAQDRKAPPVIGKHCARCEFRADAGDSRDSGYHACWQDARGWSRAQVDAGTVLDIWNFRNKDKLIARGVLGLRQVTQGDLAYKPGTEGLSASQRQWMQACGQWPGGGAFYLDRERMRAEMAAWQYPLHFIDFETARVAIPFYAGQRPYANIAFQFSHHRVDEDGTVTHASEYLGLERGTSPNYAFTRALMAAVGERGTIFMWTQHERTTLKEILEELQQDPAPPPDRDALTAFLESVTLRPDGSAGARGLYDLCELAKRTFFHPATQGSVSLKRVLPAVMAASPYLRQRYGQPIYGAPGGIVSRNFTDWQWWRAEGDQPANPYSLLPPVFEDLPGEVLDGLDADQDMQVAEGGAATTAWARIQFEDTDALQVDHVAAALRRYCELDTLAMVMVYEAWREWVRA